VVRILWLFKGFISRHETTFKEWSELYLVLDHYASSRLG
jgi:hypothetical protein